MAVSSSSSSSSIQENYTISTMFLNPRVPSEVAAASRIHVHAGGHDVVRNVNYDDVGYNQEALRIAGVIIVVIVIAFILVLFALLVCSKVRSLRGHNDPYIISDRAVATGGAVVELDNATGDYTTVNGSNADGGDGTCCSDSFYCKPISSGASE
jgi:hypothetical protein